MVTEPLKVTLQVATSVRTVALDRRPYGRVRENATVATQTEQCMVSVATQTESRSDPDEGKDREEEEPEVTQAPWTADQTVGFMDWCLDLVESLAPPVPSFEGSEPGRSTGGSP